MNTAVGIGAGLIPFHKIIETNSLPCPPCLPVRQLYQTYGETVLVISDLGLWRKNLDIMQLF
jgi:hypothetical protein